jgi:NADPH:quinone reductase-like Zn-dependent oxidoreductase
MKAYELQNSFGLDSLKITDRPEPTPGPGQVLLDMRAWSLNFRDLMVVKGTYNPRLALPFVPFSDGVGAVAAVGPDVTRVKVGERVAGIFIQDWLSGDPQESHRNSSLGGGGTGMLAEQVVLSADGVVPVPAHLTDEEAATLPCAAVTAWNALMESNQLRPGETVLVQGTGGVSLFALQFARLAGARVIATSSSDEKLQRVRQLGATETINYKTTPEWGKKARDLTAKLGVDHIVEVGGAGTLAQSLTAVRQGGTIAVIGVLSGGASELSIVPILMKTVRLHGIYVGSRDMFEAMNRAIELHQMRPVVDKVFGFDEVSQALKHMESGEHFGKICVRR